jgi:hypothetical protein
MFNSYVSLPEGIWNGRNGWKMADVYIPDIILKSFLGWEDLGWKFCLK